MPVAPITRYGRSANGTDGMPGEGSPVAISPTTAMPREVRSSSLVVRMPRTRTTRGPGTRGANRRSTRMIAIAEMPTASETRWVAGR
jgi:hypothetical protein